MSNLTYFVIQSTGLPFQGEGLSSFGERSQTIIKKKKLMGGFSPSGSTKKDWTDIAPRLVKIGTWGSRARASRNEIEGGGKQRGGQV